MTILKQLYIQFELCSWIYFRILIFLILLIILIYFIFFIFFFSLILSRKIKTPSILNFSITKDQEFILFKIKLFKVYYTTIIIWFDLILRSKGLDYILNINFIKFLILILIFYSFLFSNFLNVILFKLYLEIKFCTSYLDNINLDHINTKSKNFNLNRNFNFQYQTKNFSTSATKKNDINSEKIGDQIFYPDPSIVGDLETENLEKTTAIKILKI